MKVILQSHENLSGQARAAELALRAFREPCPGRLVGYRIDGKYYGVRWNRNSVSVYPNPSEPQQ